MEKEKDISDVDSSVDSVNNEQETVDFKTYQRLLAQRKADQEKLKKLDEYEKAAKEAMKVKELAEQEKLKQEGNLQAIIESYNKRVESVEQEKAQIEEQLNSYKSQFTDALKLSALQEVIGAKFKDKEYYSLVDTSKIAVDDSGQIDEVSLKEYAKHFVTKHKPLLDFQKQFIDSRDASNGSSISYDEWTKLAQSDPKKAREMLGKGLVK
jgi:hypothetical protein